MLVFPQMDPMNSHGFLFTRFNPRGPPAFKMEMRQQGPQGEEIPIWAMAALNISRKHHPYQPHPYDLPTWGQIKTLTNQAENLVSQQEIPRSPEYILLAMLSLLACTSPGLSSDWYPTPLCYRWSNGQSKDQSFQLMTLYICLLPGALKGPHTLKKKEN